MYFHKDIFNYNIGNYKKLHPNFLTAKLLTQIVSTGLTFFVQHWQILSPPLPNQTLSDWHRCC